MQMVKVTKAALAQEGPIWFTPPPDKRGRYPKGLWGGSSKAPAAPDPYKTADAQSQANIAAAEKQAELNRTNSQTPFGTNTWSQGSDGRWTQTMAFDPKLQGMMDQLYASAGTGQSMDPSKLPATSSSDLSGFQGGINSSVSHIMSSPTGIANNAADIARTQGLASGAGDVLIQLMSQAKDKYGQALDYSSLGAMPQANEETRSKIADALYSKSTSRLDPYWQREQSDLASSLAAQGITLGGDAYTRANTDFALGRNDAYSGARNDATIMSTDQMQKLFGMEMAARQQGVGELNYLYNLPMELMGKGQGVYSGLESSLNQDYATNIAQRQADQAIKSSQIGDTLNTFGSLAGMTTAQHGMTSGDRAQAVQEQQAATADRSALINQLMGLASGSQIAGGPQVQVGAAPVAQSIYNSYQGELDKSSANQQSKNSALGTLGGLAGAGIFAF
jgi:hypothetical protein